MSRGLGDVYKRQVRGKPLGARATNAIQMVGVAIILSITVLAVFNDISR